MKMTIIENEIRGKKYLFMIQKKTKISSNIIIYSKIMGY